MLRRKINARNGKARYTMVVAKTRMLFRILFSNHHHNTISNHGYNLPMMILFGAE